MISVLIVDDDQNKIERIERVIGDVLTEWDVDVRTAKTVYAAAKLLEKNAVDLLIVDIMIPMRDGSAPDPAGGLKLIRAITTRKELKSPRHVVGLTAYEDIYDKNHSWVSEQMWHLLHYDRSTTAWAEAIGRKLVQIAATSGPTQSGAYLTDLCVITALHKIELEAVLELSGSWSRDADEADDTIYHQGVFRRDDHSVRVVAAACYEMGMPAAAALTMKMIEKYKPKYFCMTGIAAGYKGNFGDILVVDPSWDYGSGKSKWVKGQGSVFLPAPSQLRVDPRLKAKLNLFGLDQSIRRKIQKEWKGVPTPKTSLDVQTGPVASGASVVENTPLLVEIAAHQRKVIGIEMEVYGMFMSATTARMPRPQAFALKSICDYGNGKKNDEYQRYAAYTSARYMYEFAVSFLD